MNVVRLALRQGNLDLGKRIELEKPPKAATLRAGRGWEPVERWRMLFKGTWKKTEGIATLELRTLALLARHLSGSRNSWRQRFLVLSDSMAAGGAASKGRSSIFSMLLVCRQLLVVQLVWGIRLIIRWIPSFYNNSDWPSRGGPVGVHPETREEHKDQDLGPLDQV
jgi:hypothetical protein